MTLPTTSREGGDKPLDIFVKTTDDDDLRFTGDYDYDGEKLEIRDEDGDIVALFSKSYITCFWVYGKIVGLKVVAS